MKTEIIYEDANILVCYKPAGLPVQTAKVGQMDMVSELKNYLHSAYLGIIHRLDQPVEGLLVFAKDKKSAAKLSAYLQEGTLNKQYYGVICGKPSAPGGELVDYLKKEIDRAVVVTEAYQEAKSGNTDRRNPDGTKDKMNAASNPDGTKNKMNAASKTVSRRNDQVAIESSVQQAVLQYQVMKNRNFQEEQYQAPFNIVSTAGAIKDHNCIGAQKQEQEALPVGIVGGAFGRTSLYRHRYCAGSHRRGGDISGKAWDGTACPVFIWSLRSFTGAAGAEVDRAQNGNPGYCRVNKRLCGN